MTASTRSSNKRTAQFKTQFEKLPKRIQAIAAEQFKFFLEDDQHPSLSNHQLTDSRQGRHWPNSRAVSITMRYRALYVNENGINLWYWIGTHEEYNNYIG